MTRLVLDSNVLIGDAYNRGSASHRIVSSCLGGRLVPAAVIDVDPRREPGLEPGRTVPAGFTAPGLADQLVHLAPHALEVEEEIALSRHADDLSEPRATHCPCGFRPRT